MQRRWACCDRLCKWSKVQQKQERYYCLVQGRRTFNHHRNKCYRSRFFRCCLHNCHTETIYLLKANNTPLYIYTFTNNPPTVIKQLPKMINKKIQVYLVIWKNSTKLHLSTNQHERAMDIFHQCVIIVAILKTLEEIETERLSGSTHHIAKM